MFGSYRITAELMCNVARADPFDAFQRIVSEAQEDPNSDTLTPLLPCLQAVSTGEGRGWQYLPLVFTYLVWREGIPLVITDAAWQVNMQGANDGTVLSCTQPWGSLLITVHTQGALLQYNVTFTVADKASLSQKTLNVAIVKANTWISGVSGGFLASPRS